MDVQIGAESRVRRPAAPPFAVHRAQVFDERMEMWVDLVASSQLEDYGQVYIFQRDTPWHSDTPGRIPPPVRPTAHLTQPRQHQPPQRTSSYAPSASPFGQSATSGIEDRLSPTRQPVPAMQGSLDHVPSASPGFRPASPGRYTVSRADILPTSLPPAQPPPAAYTPPAAVGYAVPQVDMPPGLASHAEKVRHVYRFLDSRAAQGVTSEEWRKAFETVRLCGDGADDNRFSTATVDDLFSGRADANADGVITFEEFQRFTEVYPKLLDSLYYRIRQHHDDERRREQLSREREVRDDLLRCMDDAVYARRNHEQRCAEAEDAVRGAQLAAEDARSREDDVLRKKQAAAAVSEAARRRADEAREVVAGAREAARGREQKMKFAVRGVSAAERKLQDQRDAAEAAAQKLARLEEAVAAQRRELDRCEKLVGDAEHSVSAARADVDALADPASDSEMQAAQAAQDAADAELRGALEKEQEAGLEHREVQREVQKAQQARVAADREVEKRSRGLEQLKAEEDDCEKRYHEQRAVTEDLEEREVQYEDNRRGEEAKENELLQLEVRLREQRDAVERKEEHLRSVHREFAQETGRATVSLDARRV